MRYTAFLKSSRTVNSPTLTHSADCTSLSLLSASFGLIALCPPPCLSCSCCVQITASHIAANMQLNGMLNKGNHPELFTDHPFRHCRRVRSTLRHKRVSRLRYVFSPSSPFFLRRTHVYTLNPSLTLFLLPCNHTFSLSTSLDRRPIQLRLSLVLYSRQVHRMCKPITYLLDGPKSECLLLLL